VPGGACGCWCGGYGGGDMTTGPRGYAAGECAGPGTPIQASGGEPGPCCIGICIGIGSGMAPYGGPAKWAGGGVGAPYGTPRGSSPAGCPAFGGPYRGWL
jgi:hypothetical protein